MIRSFFISFRNFFKNVNSIFQKFYSMFLRKIQKFYPFHQFLCQKFDWTHKIMAESDKSIFFNKMGQKNFHQHEILNDFLILIWNFFKIFSLGNFSQKKFSIDFKLKFQPLKIHFLKNLLKNEIFSSKILYYILQNFLFEGWFFFCLNEKLTKSWLETD